MSDPRISVVELFSGCGGLSLGLASAGLRVAKGFDYEPRVKYAFEFSHGEGTFREIGIADTTADMVCDAFGNANVTCLVGGPPCTPFSAMNVHRRAEKNHSWGCLGHFERLVEQVLPDVVVLENVSRVVSVGREPLASLCRVLDESGYHHDGKVVNFADYGVPQTRKRFILLASRLSPIEVPPPLMRQDRVTVREAIGGLRPLRPGESDPDDRLHFAPPLSRLTWARIRCTPPDGGDYTSWPVELLRQCTRRNHGKYRDMHARMYWDRPATTVTTSFTTAGHGRFVHPEQDRSITIREGAILQGFPYHASYRDMFWPPDSPLNRSAACRMIGNAVPPPVGAAIGEVIRCHVHQHLLAVKNKETA